MREALKSDYKPQKGENMKHRMRSAIEVMLVLALFSVLFVGCLGGDDEEEELAEPAAETITAADGGTVATADNSASIDIPADALDEDTEITIEAKSTSGMPNEENLGSAAYEFGPDGTQFNSPVTIALAFDGEVPDDMEAILAVLEDGVWVGVEGSSLSGGKVSGDVTHFSTYVILFIDGEMVLTTAECAGFEFEACGGDVVGTWKIKDVCIEMVIGENPFEGITECESIVYEYLVDWQGTFIINADGSMEMNDYGYTVSMNVEVTDACFDAAWPNNTPAENCAGIADNDTIGDCTHANGVCTCTGGEETMTFVEEMTGTWSASGTTLTTESSQSDGPSSAEYCVKDGILAAETDMGEDNTGYILMEKQ